MKLKASRIANVSLPAGVDQYTVDKLASSASQNLAAIMQLAGISRIALGSVKTLSTETHVVAEHSFFDGAPDFLVALAPRILDPLAKAMSGLGIGEISMEPDAGDLDQLARNWKAFLPDQPVAKLDTVPAFEAKAPVAPPPNDDAPAADPGPDPAEEPVPPPKARPEPTKILGSDPKFSEKVAAMAKDLPPDVKEKLFAALTNQVYSSEGALNL